MNSWLKKQWIKLIGVLGIGGIAVALAFGGPVINDELEWKEFTENLEVIDYSHKGELVKDLKDFKGIWKPKKEDFKEIYQYVYGYDLVPWQKLDGTEMSPLVTMPNGEKKRINLIPQWEQEWNNNVERGKSKKDILEILRNDVPGGVINSDIVFASPGIKKTNYFSWIKGLISKVFAGVEFEDHFDVAAPTALVIHIPDTTGTGYSNLIRVGCWVYTSSANPQDVIAGITSVNSGGCGQAEGQLSETDDTMSGDDYTVSILQVNGDTFDDMNETCCRIQDASNMYCVRFNEVDADLYEMDGGSWATIDTGTAGIADGSTVDLICNGSSISVEDDGVEILSATDSTHSSAGKAGICLGALMVSTDDVSAQELDDFVVTVETAPPAATEEDPDLSQVIGYK